MKVSFALILITCLQVSAHSYSQEKFNFNFKRVEVSQILNTIQKEGKYRFYYNNGYISRLGRVNLEVTDASLANVLNIILGNKFNYTITNQNQVIISPVDEAGANTTTIAAADADPEIKGIITDENGNPLSGVTVTVKGTQKAVTTNAKGEFTIEAPDDAELEISYVGYRQQTFAVKGQKSISVHLQPNAGGLNEVVVVGYGTQRKRDVTGTISSVRGDDFKNLPVSNAAQALQGRASGVDIVRDDGAPGAAYSIRVRGTGTINNSDPLIVIDGVPATNLNTVNPNDIASIEILKDASSSAIYGTRAANGVVLVTTKKGSYNDQLKTSVNVYTGWSHVMKYLDLLTAPDLAQMKKEIFANDGNPQPALWDDPYFSVQRTDWQRALFGTGRTTNGDIALRGGNNKSKYSISGNYFDDKGIIVNSFFKRISGAVNSEHKIGNRIRVGENFIYSYTNGNAPDTRSTQAGLLWSALRFNPAIPVKNDDGSWGSSKENPDQLGDINNPVFTAVTTDKKSEDRRVFANVYGELDILKGLTLKVNYAYDQTSTEKYNFEVVTSDQARSNNNGLAVLTQEHDEASSWLQEIFLTYNAQFSKNHSLTLTGGYSAQTFAGSKWSAQRKGYPDPSNDHRILDNGSSANQFSSGSGNGDPYAGLQSYFIRGNYAYKGKYLLTATMRADGSSKFPKNKRWGYFPAFSAGWRISDEDFFKDKVSFISSLKLTGGWGQLGNQNINDFQYLAIIRAGGSSTIYSFGAAGNVVDGAYVISLANPNITWERAEMTNISLDFGLLNNRLTGTLTWFNKDTKDMLIPYSLVENYGANVNLSFGSGNVTVPFQNLGILNNRGLEVDLNYRGQSGKLIYSIGANAAFIKNKVTHLYGTKADYIGSKLYGRESLETSRTYEGQALASFYGFKTAGLYQNQGDIDKDPNIANDPNKANILPGDVKFLDQNGDGVVDENDRVNLGNPNPSVTLGINGNAAYRNFDLSFSFSGAFGYKLYNADRMAGLDATQNFNMYHETLNRWHGEGTSNSIPRLSRTNKNQNYRSSDLWVENGNYLSLKNISLGYTVPNWRIGKADMPATRIYVSCYNVFYITKYRGYTPELGYTDDGTNNNKQRGVDVAQYPAVRTISVGATLNF